MKLTQKQTNFAQCIFEGCSQREAYGKAGYSTNMPVAVVDIKASQLAATDKVAVRLAELRKRAEDASIMSVVERKARLSEIARARVTDYQQLGADGAYINVGPESPNTAAIAEIVSTTKYDENGGSPAVISRLTLHNPVKAIAELNKMERIGAESTTINVDNRRVVFVIGKGYTE